MDLIEKTANLYRHPWELSRAHAILNLLPKQSGATCADIGAGDGFFASQVAARMDARVFAIDTEYDQEISETGGVICYNDAALLENKSVDCMIMMDVLEHVEDERRFIALVLEKMKPHGCLIVTVPAMQFLFSSHDVFLKHYRRYSRKHLLGVLHDNGIRVERCHYFYTSLFLMRCVTVPFEKMFQSRRKGNAGIGQWGYDEKNFRTRLLVSILNCDFFMNMLLNAFSVRIPGLSLLAVCRKMP